MRSDSYGDGDKRQRDCNAVILAARSEPIRLPQAQDSTSLPRFRDARDLGGEHGFHPHKHHKIRIGPRRERIRQHARCQKHSTFVVQIQT